MIKENMKEIFGAVFIVAALVLMYFMLYWFALASFAIGLGFLLFGNDDSDNNPEFI